MNQNLNEKNNLASSPSPQNCSSDEKKITERSECLLAQLSIIFPAFGSRVGKNELEQLIAVWGSVISKLSDEQVVAALNYCKNHLDYPPSVACFQRVALGLPDSNEAFEMALNKEFGHPAIYYAYQAMGGSWGKMPEADLRHTFLRKYAYFCDKVIKGETLSFPRENNMLEAPVNITYNSFKENIAKRFGKEIANKHCSFKEEQC